MSCEWNLSAQLGFLPGQYIQAFPVLKQVDQGLSASRELGPRKKQQKGASEISSREK